jgi:hypothetical protein
MVYEILSPTLFEMAVSWDFIGDLYWDLMLISWDSMGNYC